MEEIKIGHGIHEYFIYSREYLKQEGIDEKQLPVSVLIVDTEEEKQKIVEVESKKDAIRQSQGDDKTKWVVNTKGEPCKDSFEISILRDNNNFGKNSFKWYGQTKILISSGAFKLEKDIWDELIILAEKIAETKNKKEGFIK